MTDKKESPLDRATETLYKIFLKNLTSEPGPLLGLAIESGRRQIAEDFVHPLDHYVKVVLSEVKESIRVIAKEMGVKGE